MEGLGVVYEQEEPAVDSQQTPAGDNQAAVTSVPGEETEDDEEIRALAGNPDDLDATQQLQPPPQQIPQHHDVSGGYADYTQSSGQHPQQQMEHHGGYDKNGGSTQPGKLFIGGVSWETTEETLRQHFGKYGALTDAALMKDKYTGQPRGFGFVTFADASAIDRVLEETHTLDGRSVEVKRAIPREKTAPGSSDFRGGRGGFGGGGGGGGGFTEQKKIFVGGLAPTVTEQDFRHYFEEFGKITDAVVMIDRDTQRSRGFGFITFEEESSVAEVISKNHEIHGKSVEIKRAEPKEARGGGGGGYGGRGGRGGGWRGGGRGAAGGYNGGAYGGGGGGYGGGYGSSYGGGYGAGYGGGYGSAAAYGGGYGGYPQSYAGYGYGGYGGGRGGYGYGGYAGYGGYGGAGAGGEGAGQEGGAGGEEGGYSEEGAQQGGQGGQGGAAGGYGYGYRQGGGSGGAQGGSGGRSDRYRPY